jgi:hypothetical protein
LNIYAVCVRLIVTRHIDNNGDTSVTNYTLLNFAENGASPGICVGDLVLPIEGSELANDERMARSFSSTKAILENWSKAEPLLEAAALRLSRGDISLARHAKPLASVKLLAPILYPDAILCAFSNYTDHMKEMSGREPPDKTKVDPLFFFKHPRSVIGPKDTVRLPARSQQVGLGGRTSGGDWPASPQCHC